MVLPQLNFQGTAAPETPDEFPGILGDFSPDPTVGAIYPDPDTPAAPNPDDTVLSVLKRILNRLPVPRGGYVFDSQVQNIPQVGAVELQFQTDQAATWVRVGPAQRPMAIYGGVGRGFPMGTLVAGQILVGRIAPEWKGLTVITDVGAINDQVFVLFTDEEYKVTKT